MDTILDEILCIVEAEFEKSAACQEWYKKADEFGEVVRGSGSYDVVTGDVGGFAWLALHEMARLAFRRGWELREAPNRLLDLKTVD